MRVITLPLYLISSAGPARLIIGIYMVREDKIRWVNGGPKWPGKFHMQTIFQ